MKFLIWSNEHGAWWRPNRLGYTLLLHEAGRYDAVEAGLIVASSGAWGPVPGVPNEAVMLAPEFRWQGGPPEPAFCPAAFPDSGYRHISDAVLEQLEAEAERAGDL